MIALGFGFSLFAGWGFDTCAQEAKPHVFTDKKGDAIDATLLTVSPDMKMAKIRREDKREFDLPILSLSLDDQLSGASLDNTTDRISIALIALIKAHYL